MESFCEHFDRWFSRILLLFPSNDGFRPLRLGIKFLVFLAFAAGLVWQHQVLPNDLTLIKSYPCFGYVLDSVTVHFVLKLLATLCGRNYNIQTCVVTILCFHLWNLKWLNDILLLHHKIFISFILNIPVFLRWFPSSHGIWGPCGDPSIHSLTRCLPQKPPEKWDIPCTRAQAGWRFHGSTDMLEIYSRFQQLLEGSKHRLYKGWWQLNYVLYIFTPDP